MRKLIEEANEEKIVFKKHEETHPHIVEYTTNYPFSFDTWKRFKTEKWAKRCFKWLKFLKYQNIKRSVDIKGDENV